MNLCLIDVCMRPPAAAARASDLTHTTVIIEKLMSFALRPQYSTAVLIVLMLNASTLSARSAHQ